MLATSEDGISHSSLADGTALYHFMGTPRSEIHRAKVSCLFAEYIVLAEVSVTRVLKVCFLAFLGNARIGGICGLAYSWLEFGSLLDSPDGSF